MRHADLPVVIQGGMGVGVSSWQLARTVSAAGQLGVVSGVALDTLLARRLQLGDPGGHLRRALAAFPAPQVAERVLDRYFRPEGLPQGRPFRPVPRLSLRPRPQAVELTVAANFAEVFLAKEGHGGVVGINYLEKIQLATPSSLYGAMLAGVDYVLMGAGLPTEIPGLLDALARHLPVELPVAVEGADAAERHTVRLDPRELLPDHPPLRRPRFLAVVSSASLAGYLARSERTRPDGFVVESATAGGHSARPRGRMTLDTGGEPVYGERDALDLAKVAACGLPFWVAGGQAGPRPLALARAAGAVGVQVGSAFALCRESGMAGSLRQRLLRDAAAGVLAVRNDPGASPTGFPFKVAQLAGTVADPQVYAARPRRCDLSYLRTPYRKPGGGVGFRCPAEPVDDFVRKGGSAEQAVGSRCLCNGLTATIALGQRRSGDYDEPPLVTIGQELEFLAGLRQRAGDDFSALDVLHHLLTQE